MKFIETIAACLLLTLLPPYARSSDTNSAKPLKVAAFALKDQYDTPHSISFPSTNLIVLIVADQKGSEQIDSWIAPLKARYAARIDLTGIADLGKVPSALRGMVQSKFKKHRPYPVMLDWGGQIARSFGCEKNKAGVFVIHRDGSLLLRLSGAANEESLSSAYAAIDRALRAGAAITSR